MRNRSFFAAAALMMAAVMLALSVIPAAALDTKYTFDDFKMSIRISRNYTVITRDSERSDEAFGDLALDYDETMTAFNAADIYLQAYAPDDTYKITLTVNEDDNSRSVNNYSDLTPAQREEILNHLLADASCTGGSENRHGGNIFFDILLTGSVDDKTVYIAQDQTVINGLNINLTLQKEGEEIMVEEIRALSDIAGSLNFDKIVLKNTGPSFEWWRVLLWIGILVVISILISLIYRHNNKNKQRRSDQRRLHQDRRSTALPQKDAESAQDQAKDAADAPSFERVLGYQSDDEYMDRASTDLESFDISVRDRDPQKGIDFFEDEGDGIDDGTDYFDNYFNEQTPRRTAAQRAAGTVGAYIKIAFTHLGYFFRNIGKTIAKFFRGGKNNR